MGSDWTKEFRDKLEDWRQPAPEGLWEAVSESLDRSGSAPSNSIGLRFAL